MSGPFNPSLGTFGGFPQNPSKLTLYTGTAGNDVGYFEGAMKWCFGQSLYVDPNWGPWRMLTQDMASLANLHNFWINVPGIAEDKAAQRCGAASWGVVDYVVYQHGYQ